MKRVILTIAVCLGLFGPAFADCKGGSTSALGDFQVTRLDGKVFFRTRELELDFDGSPIAYGVRDQGQENICAGLAPNSGVCRGKFRGACYPVCRNTFAAWSQGGANPATLGKTMCSVGLGGSGCSVPQGRLQSAPAQDWFVSETSLKTSPEKGPATGAWLQGQAAQLDPSTVRYLVIPSSLRGAPWNLGFGDVGVAVNAVTGEQVPFILGDGGGLGEGSVSLLASLRPQNPPRLTEVRSALGENVMRYTSGISGDFRFVIFPGSAQRVAGSKTVMALPASQLPQWIETTATTLFRDKSSKTEVLACSVG